MSHSAAAHIATGSPDLARAAEDRLVGEGVQWTALREQVFAALARDESPVSAYDVAERVSAAVQRRIAANSVYRILDLFVAHGVAKRIESRNAYVANTHPGCQHDCIFLVCEDCGRIRHIDDDSLASAMRARARNVGFTPNRPVLEMLGRCADCAT